MQFLFRDETRELNETTRKEADSGAFTLLSNGVTHYELAGPSDSPLIVLVHGFSVPYFIYDPTFEFLSKSGFPVLRYDLFGRGYSDRPHVQYNIDLFVNQLKELTDKFSADRPFILTGLSMGGPITTSFLVRHPERVRKHILIDPCGIEPIDTASYLQAAKIPLVAELIFSLFGTDNMINSVAGDFFDPALVEHFQAKYKVQMIFKGFKRAILSTIRNHMLGSFLDAYRRAGELRKPTLLFWGRNDRTVPFEQSAELYRLLPYAQFHVIENCGHIPHYERPEEVNPILLKFIRES